MLAIDRVDQILDERERSGGGIAAAWLGTAREQVSALHRAPFKHRVGSAQNLLSCVVDAAGHVHIAGSPGRP